MITYHYSPSAQINSSVFYLDTNTFAFKNRPPNIGDSSLQSQNLHDKIRVHEILSRMYEAFQTWGHDTSRALFP